MTRFTLVCEALFKWVHTALCVMQVIAVAQFCGFA